MASDLDLFEEPADAPAPPAPPVKVACGRAYMPGLNYCRVGGGFAPLSDDMGRSWFCREHAPPGFFPHTR